MGIFDKIKSLFKSELPPEKPFLQDYSIVRQTTGGTIATTYLIKNKKSKELALMKKIIPSGRDGMKILTRELTITLMLDHPAIVKTIGYEKKDDAYYVLMEFVPGYSLRDYVRFKCIIKPTVPPFLNTTQYCQIYLELADALQYLHSLQVLHMDIKPENVMIVKDPGEIKNVNTSQRPEDTTYMLANVPKEHILASEDKAVSTTVKLVDFGLSVRFYEIQEARGGSLFYAAPEIFSPNRADLVGSHTDIYSLGSTMFELACGEPPLLPSFFKKTQKNWLNYLTEYQKLDPAVRKNMEADLIKIKQRTTPTCEKISYDAKIKDILTKSLEFDVSRRYQNARELVLDIMDVRDHIVRGLIK